MLDFSSENQEILQDMSQSETIDAQPVKDGELLQMETLAKKSDQELRSVLIGSDLFDHADKLDLKADLPVSNSR
jgi:hypothetical protein